MQTYKLALKKILIYTYLFHYKESIAYISNACDCLSITTKPGPYTQSDEGT